MRSVFLKEWRGGLLDLLPQQNLTLLETVLVLQVRVLPVVLVCLQVVLVFPAGHRVVQVSHQVVLIRVVRFPPNLLVVEVVLKVPRLQFLHLQALVLHRLVRVAVSLVRAARPVLPNQVCPATLQKVQRVLVVILRAVARAVQVVLYQVARPAVCPALGVPAVPAV